MSYTPTEWASGDVITAEKLNKIESGIESVSQSQIVVKLLEQVDNYGFSTDKSFSEVAEFVGRGNYNVVLAPGSSSIAGGKVFTLSTVNYDYATGDVSRLIFSSIDATSSTISIASLAWLPSNSNTVSGEIKYIN